jgi:hypothetical protein
MDNLPWSPVTLEIKEWFLTEASEPPQQDIPDELVVRQSVSHPTSRLTKMSRKGFGQSGADIMVAAAPVCFSSARAPYGLVIQTTTPITKPQPLQLAITTTKPITMVITMVIYHVL